MKVILPFDHYRVLGEEWTDLLTKLGLEDHQVVDQVLLHWPTYAFGSVEDVYELTVDELTSYFDDRYRADSYGDRAHDVLRENADEVVRLHTHVAKYLEDLLRHFPDEWSREMSKEDESYHFLRVEQIDYLGSRLILTTDAVDV